MGQRSQIYVRYLNEKEEKELIARYFQWNYGERMISRARYTMEWIKSHMDLVLKFDDVACLSRYHADILCRIIDVNFDYKDIVMSTDILKEYSELGDGCSFTSFVFTGMDNNNGQLYIDVLADGSIKYAFVSPYDMNNIMDAEQYMDWDNRNCYNPDWRHSEYIDAKTCEDNIAKIGKLAELMTAKELQDFIHDDYKNVIKSSNKTIDNELPF